MKRKDIIALGIGVVALTALAIATVSQVKKRRGTKSSKNDYSETDISRN